NAGLYTFFLNSDDGSRLFINGNLVVDNGGVHAALEIAGSLELSAGEHEVKLEFFQSSLSAVCQWSWAREGLRKQIVPADVLFHVETEGLGPLLVPLPAAAARGVTTNGVMTDVEGTFKFSHLRPGWYQVRICAPAGGIYLGDKGEGFRFE